MTLARWRRQRPQALGIVHSGRLAGLQDRPYQLSTDAWSHAPSFGFDFLADAIAKVILESDPQLTVAVYGDWGVGKTTLLRAIQERIAEQCVVAWFDIWETRNEEQVLPRLLDAIAAQLPKRSEVAKDLRAVARVALAGASLSAGPVSLSGKDLVAYIDEMSKAPKVERAQLQQIVHRWQRSNEGKRIVVIVDNLDRCLPSEAVNLLERVTALFGFPGVMFLLAADRDRLALAVEEIHGLEAGEGFVYLEKIIQVEFRVPGVQRDHFLRWLRSLVREPLSLDHDESLFVAETAEWNPRQAKRLLNNIRIQLCTARRDITQDGGLTLVSTLLLHRNSDAWLQLTGSPAIRQMVNGQINVPEVQLIESPWSPLADDLIRRILKSNAGLRLLAMSDENLQQFLSATEAGLPPIHPDIDDLWYEGSVGGPTSAQHRCDLVLSGGGLPTAIGLVGALTVLEDYGYVIHSSAGAMGGAVVATLLACGYTPAEVRQLLSTLVYSNFLDRGNQRHSGKRRFYGLDYLAEWVNAVLQSRGVRTFADLRLDDDPGISRPPSEQYRLSLIASTQDGKLVYFPRDFVTLGFDPDSQPVTTALLAATATPDFFEPVTVGELVLSALPESMSLTGEMMRLFDRSDGLPPRWSTMGIQLIPEGQILEHGERRVIDVSNIGTRSTSFLLTQDTQLALYESGRQAAQESFQRTP